MITLHYYSRFLIKQGQCHFKLGYFLFEQQSQELIIWVVCLGVFEGSWALDVVWPAMRKERGFSLHYLQAYQVHIRQTLL